MSSTDSIFEIREYLDNDGKVSSHDVTDISKELEYMEKLVNSMQESAPALNEEDQFIRELALLAQQEESMDEEVVDDTFFDSFEAKESVVETKKVPLLVKKAAGTGEKQKSGWGKGFLSKSKPVADKPKSVTKPSADGTVFTHSIEKATQQMSISENNATSVASKASTATESAAPLKGILKHTAAPVGPTSTSSDEPSDTNSSTSAAMPNTAFSGGIVERAPTAKPMTKSGGGSNIILGPKKKHT